MSYIEYSIELTISDSDIFECTDCQYTVIEYDDNDRNSYQDNWLVLSSEKVGDQVQFIFQSPDNRWKFEGPCVIDRITEELVMKLDRYMEREEKW